MSATINNHSAVALEPELLTHDRPASLAGLPVNHEPEPHPCHPRIPSHDESASGPVQPHKNTGGRKLLIAILVAVVIVAVLLWQRSSTFKQLAVTTTDMAIPTVSTVTAQPGPGQTEIQLPGNLMAFTEASIYARTNGYVKAWYTDLGAQVKAGQLMAELEAPDVDAELRQARATLAQARATLEIDQLNFNRGQNLLATKVISQQEFDQDRTTLDAQKAAVLAADANVQNLTVQTQFQQITAPFTGIVTRRDTDVGALINAGSSNTSSSAQELFHIARTDVLRVFISVPEVYAPMVRLDTPAFLELAEAPGVKFQGKIAHIAGAIDATSRTLQTEVQVPNADDRLFPGAYATVHLILKLADAPMVIPINTVLFRTQGTQVGVVDASNIVHLKSITVGHDFGTSYEITGGVTASDRLVLNPSDSLADGEKVIVQNAATPAPK
jgi:RND family efflux transporter MFP subunit